MSTEQPFLILFSSSLYFPSQPQSVYPPLTFLSNLSGRQEKNQQGHPGGRATSGGGRDPSSPLSFPSFESNQSSSPLSFPYFESPQSLKSQTDTLMNLLTISEISKTTKAAKRMKKCKTKKMVKPNPPICI